MRAVASIADAPLDLCVVVRPDLAATSGADLKSRKITTSSPFALTAWMVREMSRQQGWGPDGVELVTMLSAAAWPLLRTREVDGISTDLGSGLMGEKHGAGRVIVRFNDIIRDFHVYHVSATDKIAQARPDLVKAFVAGWLESVAFARANREKAIAVAARVTGMDEDVSRSLYDAMMPLISGDGKFNSKAMDALARSFVDLKLLDAVPDVAPLYSERFLP